MVKSTGFRVRWVWGIILVVLFVISIVLGKLLNLLGFSIFS